MFRGLLRPGQGFKPFRILRREGGLTKTGRPHTAVLVPEGEFLGIISQATPKEIEQHKQLGSPITHTIVQYGALVRAYSTDVLELVEPRPDGNVIRRFEVKGNPQDPGELGHVLVYKVEERNDLQ